MGQNGTAHLPLFQLSTLPHTGLGRWCGVHLWSRNLGWESDREIQAYDYVQPCTFNYLKINERDSSHDDILMRPHSADLQQTRFSSKQQEEEPERLPCERTRWLLGLRGTPWSRNCSYTLQHVRCECGASSNYRVSVTSSTKLVKLKPRVSFVDPYRQSS